HRLRDLADQPVQGLDLEQARFRGPVVARLRALLLVAARGEGAVAGAREAHHTDVPVRPRRLEAADQLVNRLRAEGVEPVLAVDRYPGEAVLHLEEHVVHALLFGYSIVNPPLTASVCPVTKPVSSDARR